MAQLHNTPLCLAVCFSVAEPLGGLVAWDFVIWGAGEPLLGGGGGMGVGEKSSPRYSARLGVQRQDLGCCWLVWPRMARPGAWSLWSEGSAECEPPAGLQSGRLAWQRSPRVLPTGVEGCGAICEEHTRQRPGRSPPMGAGLGLCSGELERNAPPPAPQPP